MKTLLNHSYYVLFLLLFVACSGGNNVKIGNQQATEQQSADLTTSTIDPLHSNEQQEEGDEDVSEEITFIPRFAILDLTGKKLIYSKSIFDDYPEIDEAMAKRYTHCIYEGQVFPITYEKRQEEAPDWNHVSLNSRFDEMGGSVFKLTEGCLHSAEELASDNRVSKTYCDALLVDEHFVEGLEMLPIVKKNSEIYSGFDEEEEEEGEGEGEGSIIINRYDPAPGNLIEYYQTQFKREIVGAITLAQTAQTTIHYAIYSTPKGNDSKGSMLMGVITLDDGSRVIGEPKNINGNEWIEIKSVMRKNGKYRIIYIQRNGDYSSSIFIEEEENQFKLHKESPSTRLVPLGYM